MIELATIGGGCYWCLEAIYKRVSGVKTVVSGYSGGQTDHPTTMQVYGGTTGHAEVVQLAFDTGVISYREILEIFFVMHDPTTLNRQGHDIGEIYRSIILYHDDAQNKVAMEMAAGFAAKLWNDKVTTQIVRFEEFWPAEQDSQDFYDNNPGVGYCQVVINPKIQKLRRKFGAKLKP